MTRARATVARIASTEDETVLRGHGIEVLRGRARFTGRHTVEVAGRQIQGARIVIAAGACPWCRRFVVLPLGLAIFWR
ncbi:MAG: hypothetical protein ACRDSE_22825 [Pseudonocardiaceae bacterium]